mgnify:CR=1 FL=1
MIRKIKNPENLIGMSKIKSILIGMKMRKIKNCSILGQEAQEQFDYNE